MNIRRIAITGATALAVVAVGTAAGAAIAAGPIDSSGVIHACYFPAGMDGSSRIVLPPRSVITAHGPRSRTPRGAHSKPSTAPMRACSARDA